MKRRQYISKAIVATAIMLSLAGCGKDGQPVTAQSIIADSATVTSSPAPAPEESPEPTLSPSPAPTATPAPTEEPVEESSEQQASEESASTETSIAESETSIEESLGYEIIPIEDKVLYATQACNLRQGPGTDYDKIGGLSYAQQITVNGKVETIDGKVWFVLKTEDSSLQMVSGGLVSETKPVQQTSQPTENNSSAGTGNTGESNVDTNNGNNGSEETNTGNSGSIEDWAASLGLPVGGGPGSGGNDPNLDISWE